MEAVQNAKIRKHFFYQSEPQKQVDKYGTIPAQFHSSALHYFLILLKYLYFTLLLPYKVNYNEGHLFIYCSPLRKVSS